MSFSVHAQGDFAPLPDAVTGQARRNPQRTLKGVKALAASSLVVVHNPPISVQHLQAVDTDYKTFLIYKKKYLTMQK